MRKRIITLLAGLTLAAGAVVALSTPADASHVVLTCSGTQIESRWISSPIYGHVGTLDLRLKSNGTKCLKTLATGVTYGTPHYMQAIIIPADGDTDFDDFIPYINGGIPCHSTVRCDDGNYSYYAGPVGVANAIGECMDIYGVSAWGGLTWDRALYNVGCD